MSQRSVTHEYRDPLDAVWLATAGALGLTVERVPDAYASTDGQGKLYIGTDDTLDADDCLAQMILHEICHWLVMGAGSANVRDWGLDNETDRDVALEHACLRLQAALLEPLGLRQVLAPTTDYRAFYDSLGPDPFTSPTSEEEDGSVVRARVALTRSRNAPWAPHLAEALAATADIVHAAARAGAKKAAGEKDLYALVRPRAAPHPTGFVLDAVPGRTCGECSWHFVSGGRSACRQAEARTEASYPSCERFENAVECLSCGACCREAYDVVAVSPRDPAVKKHPELVVVREGRAELQRPGGRCVALRGGKAVPGTTVLDASDRPEPPLHLPSGEPFTCTMYEDRPRTCRDFALGGSHCLWARRRVGLSR